MKSSISVTHNCGHIQIHEHTCSGKGTGKTTMWANPGELPGQETAGLVTVTRARATEIQTLRAWPASEPCRECWLRDRPQDEALAIDAALAAGGRLARNGRVFYRFGSGVCHLGGDVPALAVVAEGVVYVTTPPQGDHPWISAEDVARSLGYKRPRRTPRVTNEMRCQIVRGRRDGWVRFREAVADLWPGRVVITCPVNSDDGYYRLICVDGFAQTQSPGGHRDLEEAEMKTLEAAWELAKAQASHLGQKG